MKLTYKEVLEQDQTKLRADILEIFTAENSSLMSFAKKVGLPYSTMRRWLIDEKDIESYRSLIKVLAYLEKKKSEPKAVDGQINIK